MLNKVKNTVAQALDQILANGDHFVVEVKITADLRKIWVALDGDNGVDIEYCAEVSRKLGAELDELEDLGAYVLEVSSPGADAPLRYIRQYPKHVGRELKVKLTDGSEFKGMLEAVGDGSLSFGYTHKEKGKKAEQRTRTLPFEEVETAKVIISFK